MKNKTDRCIKASNHSTIARVCDRHNGQCQILLVISVAVPLMLRIHFLHHFSKNHIIVYKKYYNLA